MLSGGNSNVDQEDEIKFTEADRLRNESKFVEALSVLEQLLPRYPKKVSLLFTLAHVNWELQNFERAADLFRTVTHINPKSEMASLGLFHCLWGIGKQEEALDEVKRFMAVSYSKDYVRIIREINEENKTEAS